MEKFPKFLKNAAKVAAVSVIGLMPNQLKGQDIINDGEKEINIENTIELKNQIFNEVENGYKNGILKNTPEDIYFFRLEKDGYDITYDLDANYDKKKDEKPTIEIDYSNGRSHYILQKGKVNRDIVYNYEDKSLSDVKTKSYEDFVAENMIIIPELYGKNKELINYRVINKREKEKFLIDIRQFFKEVDSVGIKENNKNTEWVESGHRGISKSELMENETSNLAKQLLDKLKSQTYPGEFVDESSGFKLIPRGMFTYEFGEYEFNVYFIDNDYNKNEINFQINNGKTKLFNMKKIVKLEGEEKTKYLNEEETLNIVKEALIELE